MYLKNVKLLIYNVLFIIQAVNVPLYFFESSGLYDRSGDC